jgi:cytochrome c553
LEQRQHDQNRLPGINSGDAHYDICCSRRGLGRNDSLRAAPRSCHRLDGATGAIPSIVGKSQEEFIALLVAYRDGHKPNPVMVSVARSLDDEQMAALAAYFGSLPAPTNQPGPTR